MRFKIRFASQIVGLFVLGGIVALVGVLILLGVNQRWFSKNYHFYTYFSEAHGIKPGMGIQFKGFAIGKVTDITLDEDNRVKVFFYIEDRFYDKVYEDSVLAVVSNPLGLGGGLVFYQGKSPTPPLPEGSLIPSLDFEEGRRLVEEGRVDIPPGADAITRLLGEVEPVLQNLNTVLLSLDRTLTTVEAGLSGNEGVALGAVLQRIEGIAANIETLSSGLSEVEGLVPRLLGARGSLAKILDDEMELYGTIEASLNELEAAISNLRQFTEFLTSTEPQLVGTLEEGKQAIRRGREVLEGIRNNPLIRGGIPEEQTQETLLEPLREGAFR